MSKSPYLLSSVNNALKILDILSVKDGIGVAEIARIAKLDKTSVFKLLFTLEHRDYVSKSEDAKYYLGVKFTNYGNIVANRQSLTEVAKPFMRNLVDRCKETVCIATLNTNGKVIITNLMEGTSKDHITARIGYEMDAYDNANGKLLLAHLDDSMRDSMISYIRFIQRTPYTIVSKDLLLQQLSMIKEAPYVEQYEEFYLGHADIAAPIYDMNHHVIAAISIACTPKALKENHDFYIKNLCKSAEMLSRKMGYNKEVSI